MTRTRGGPNDAFSEERSTDVQQFSEFSFFVYSAFKLFLSFQQRFRFLCRRSRVRITTNLENLIYLFYIISIRRLLFDDDDDDYRKSVFHLSLISSLKMVFFWAALDSSLATFKINNRRPTAIPSSEAYFGFRSGGRFFIRGTHLSFSSVIHYPLISSHLISRYCRRLLIKIFYPLNVTSSARVLVVFLLMVSSRHLPPVTFPVALMLLRDCFSSNYCFLLLLLSFFPIDYQIRFLLKVTLLEPFSDRLREHIEINILAKILRALTIYSLYSLLYIVRHRLIVFFFF